MSNYTNYTIQKGDTLWKIAKEHYGVTNNQDIMAKIQEIAEENNIADPNLIFTGSNLKLSTDVVEIGETTKNDNDVTNNDTGSGITGGTGSTDGAVTGSTITNVNNNNGVNNGFVLDMEIYENFDTWRIAYRDSLQKFEDGGSQTDLDNELDSLYRSFDFNQDNHYEDNLKHIAGGLFASLNDNNDVGVGYDKFLNWYTQGLTTRETGELYAQEERFRSAFDQLAGENGLLDSEEFETMFKIFDNIDTTQDGKIEHKIFTDINYFTKSTMGSRNY